jgi:DNA-binding CsgD family transcriptional regulator
MPLSDALKALAGGLGAQAAAIARHIKNEDRARAVSLFDIRSGDAEIPVLRRPFCQDVMGYLFNKARVSTVWFMSDHQEDENWHGTQTLTNWMISRAVGDIVVISLAGTHLQHDYIEFHFGEELSRGDKSEIEALVPTLVRAWAGRKTGLVTQAQMDDRMVRARAVAAAGKLKPEAPILGMSNPARLSRAEFRVCLLLSRGLSVKGVTDELGLSEATIRSHLRSIYSKTETSGLPELVYRILSAAPDQSDAAFGTS